MNFKKNLLTVIRPTLWAFLVIHLQSCDKEKKTKPSEATTAQKPQVSDRLLLIKADTLFGKGERLKMLKQNDNALHYHLEAFAIRDRILTNDERLVNSCVAVSNIYLLSDKFEKAIIYLEKAKSVAESLNLSRESLFDIYSSLSHCSCEMKDFPGAISFAKRMMDIAKESHSSDQMANAYLRMANVSYYQKNYREAIGTWEKVVSLAMANDHALLGKVFFNIASAYRANKENDKALIYVNKSIIHEKVRSGPRSEEVAKRLLPKAFMLHALGKNDSARYLLHLVLSIRREANGDKNLYTFGAKNSLGRFYDRGNELDSSLWYHHQSLISLVGNFNDNDWGSNPKPDADELNNDLVLGLTSKAEALRRLYEKNPSRIDMLDLSLSTDLLADSVLEEYKKNLAWDESVLELLEGSYVSYTKMMDKAFALFQSTHDQKYIQAAFKIMEHSRASVLQIAFNRANAFGSTGLSGELRDNENKLIATRSSLLKDLSAVGKGEKNDSLYGQLLKVDEDYQKLQELIKKNNPSYFSIKFERPNISFPELHKILKEKNSTLIEYHWSPQNIYSVTIDAHEARFAAIPLTKELSEAIEEFNHEFQVDPESSLELKRFQRFCMNSSFVYDQLLKGLLKDILAETHLIISADGPLATFPFEALLTDKTKSEEVNYRLPYLVTRHPVSYSFSTSVLLKQMSHERKGSKLLAMGYAGQGFSRQNRNGMNDLPGTEKEIAAIKEVMKNHVNHYYVEGGSTEYNFKKQAAAYDVVHLALHGEADTLNSTNSKLIFRTEHDTLEDGELFAHELYDLNLHQLDLAVLSACESGIGKRQKGEGVMSIARGFAYAGCPSLVISLWKINDQTTAEVMAKFYSNLSEGRPIDVSLAQAKRDYINGASEINSHPFYWAAFLQVGNSAELDITKPNRWGWALLLLGIVTIPVLLFKRPVWKSLCLFLLFLF